MLSARRLLVAVAVCAATLVTPNVAAAADSHQTYVVREGDSLFAIASRHRIPVRELLSANDLTLSSVILPGQRLTIPGDGNPGDTDSAPPAATYTVVTGDSLSRIASRHGVTLGALLNTNDLTITSLILPGRQLTLPAGATTPAPSPNTATPGATTGHTYTVVAGDSLSRIANRHHVTLGALLNTNNLTITSLILPGRQLTLPAGATATQTAPTQASSPLQTVIDYAIAQRGKSYRFFTKGPDSFDCSGLTAAAYAQVGRTLVHYSAAQALQGTPVDFENEPILPGDLIFMKRHGSATINHVGMAISTTAWIQAAGPETGVSVGPMPPDAFITSVRRILPG